MRVEQVFFASVHLEHEGFYPDHRVGAEGSAPGLKNIISLPLRYGTASADFRRLVASRLLPPLAAFQPDLVLVSAGFDGHRDDIQGNSGGLMLGDDDYVRLPPPFLPLRDCTPHVAVESAHSASLVGCACAAGMDHRGAPQDRRQVRAGLRAENATC